MTAPLTPPPPPHEPSSEDRRQPHPDWQAKTAPGSAGHPVYPGAYEASYGQDGPGMKTELREAAVITVAVALAGALLGVLWAWLTPHVPLVADATAVYLKDTEGEQAIGVDGTFTLLALGFGAVSALVVFLLRRRGGVPLVIALGLGGLLGSLLAWRVGIWLGPPQNVVAHAKAVGKGVTFSAPLKLGAKGALLAWSLSALVVHLGLMALFGPRDPDPYEQHPYQATPPGPPAA
ncbi:MULTISPECIES: AAA family ATPase [unclassified Streptomyces]|uniref:AAA family ATPase n=1 Tax=unclassified Streptomyces TaxID=2593676 RepID=UPI00342554C7